MKIKRTKRNPNQNEIIKKKRGNTTEKYQISNRFFYSFVHSSRIVPRHFDSVEVCVCLTLTIEMYP